MERAAPDMRRGGIAVLDSDGVVSWIDEAWSSDEGEDGLPRPPIGANLLQAYRGRDDPTAQAVANAIAAVLETYSHTMINRVVSESPSFLPADRYLTTRLIHLPWLEPNEERREVTSTWEDRPRRGRGSRKR